MRARKAMNPAPRSVHECLPSARFTMLGAYLPAIPDAFDVAQFAADTGLDLFEAAELLSAAVADDFI